MYAIKTEKLTKKYKEKTAVSNLDLKINEGEMYGLLGVNGAGKTTTMKMLTTLIMPTSGEAELLGHSIKTDRAAVKADYRNFTAGKCGGNEPYRKRKP